MIGGKLPARPHTAPNSFRRGRILKAKEEPHHGTPDNARRTSPGGRNRVLKGSNTFNSQAAGAHENQRQTTPGRDEGAHDAVEANPADSRSRTLSPRNRRRVRQMNGAYGAVSPRLPGIGARDGEEPTAKMNGSRGPSPRRGPHGPVGDGISPRGAQNGFLARGPQNANSRGCIPPSQGWGASEGAPATVSGTKNAPRQARQDQPASPPSSPPQGTQQEIDARDIGMDVLETTQQAELQELQLDLEAARSAAAKAEAEKELAEVQQQVMQQECDMEIKRMARETQILQDELDEMKARFRSVQEEHDKKIRGKDRYIQVLWRTLEVHKIASPFASEPGSGDLSVDSLTTRIVTLAGGEAGSLPEQRFKAKIPEICGMPSFFGARLLAHTRHASKVDTKADVTAVSFIKMWTNRIYPLDHSQRFFRLLSHPAGASECITINTLQPLVHEILVENPQLISGTAVEITDDKAVGRIAAVLGQRIMHFCCRGGVRRMTRLDYDSSDLGDVLQILAQGGDNSPASLDKVAAFFAIEEADQVVTCFDKLDEDGDGFLDIQNMLTARNAGGEDGEAGVIPRCGAFTLTQAAIEGVFARCATGSKNLMDLNGFTELFHAYVYPHAPCAMRFWFDVADSDHDGRMRPDDIERMLQEQVFILNTHLEAQGEQPVFQLDNLMQQVMDMLGPPQGMAGGASWCCAEVLSSRAGLVVFDVLFNYEVLLRYERQATSTGGQPYITCALNS